MAGFEKGKGAVLPLAGIPPGNALSNWASSITIHVRMVLEHHPIRVLTNFWQAPC